MRWVRLLVAVATGVTIGLAGGGVARADAVQTLVDGAGADAAARGTTAGIAMVDRVTGRYVDNGANARRRFGSASLVKLFIADSVLRRARLGQISLTAADRGSLGLMLRSSDDAAASSFWVRFGANAIVTDVVGRYRLTETAPPVNPRYWGLTQVSAHDLATFYTGMLAGTGTLAAADRDFIVAQLRASTARGTDGVYQWFGLHDGLPREPVLGVKQGWMCCFSDGYIWRHSTGIVGKDARYVVAVLTRDPGSKGSAHTVTSSTRVVQHAFPAGLVPRVQGRIGDLWYAMGGHRSVLGVPTGNETPRPGGAMSPFEHGVIYWSPATGPHWVIGDILKAWTAVQRDTGRLGYPTSDEIALTGGALGRFQGGYVYWSPSTGAHWVVGQILGAYGGQKWERGPLGYPTSDEIALPGGAVSRFQGGSIYWSPSTGAHRLGGALLQAYLAQPEGQSPLGYPTSDPHAVPAGTRVDFQHGSLTLTAAGTVVRELSTPQAARVAVPTPEAAPKPQAVPTPSLPTPSPPTSGTPTSSTTPSTTPSAGTMTTTTPPAPTGTTSATPSPGETTVGEAG